MTPFSLSGPRSRWPLFSRRRETVAHLSNFPIGMSFPALNIRNRSELRQRFREVFVDPVNASKCFAQTEPSRDTENPELFTVACRNDTGSDAAAYQVRAHEIGLAIHSLSTFYNLPVSVECHTSRPSSTWLDGVRSLG